MKVFEKTATLSGLKRNSRWKTVLTALAAGIGCLSSTNASDAPPHNISAANLNVVQNDTGNTADSVTVTSTLSINDMRVRAGSNRGDYNLQVGDSAADDLAEGLPLVSISQNGRDNGELGEGQLNYAAPAFDGNASGYWAVIQDTTSDRAEYNINCAVAFFRYTNWLCGWTRNATGANGTATDTNNLFTGSPGLTIQNFNGVASGRTHLDLRNEGVDSTQSGIILVNHGKNEGNYAVSKVNPDGTWEVYVRDNFGNNTAVEQDPAAFVFIPKTNTLVVSGKFGLDATGTNAITLMYSGGSPAFSITNIAVGRYRLTVTSGSPTAGVLIISPEATATNATGFDNVLSYEPDGDGWIIEDRDTGVFPPVLEATTNQPIANFLYIPAATAGFTIAPTNTLVTTEFGLSANFTVKLDLAPTNLVTVPVSSSNPAEGIVSTNLLTFDPTNWNIPQVVTVTGVDDGVADGPVNYTIVLGAATSADTNYLNLDPADVSVVNIDDEQPGITVTPTNGLATTESGGQAVFAIFLNKQPAADVTVSLSSDNTAEGTLSMSSVTFTHDNWSTPQLVIVTGVNDFRVDGDQPYHIVTAAATSADPSYNGVDPDDVTLVNLDNDSPAIIYNAAAPLTVIEGQTTTYTIVLATQPDSNVVVQTRSSDVPHATVAPATLTFTPGNWNVPQTVTITGVDNLVTNGTVNFNVTNNVTSTDPLYVNFAAPNAGPKIFSGIVLDNESQLVLSSGDCIYGIGMPDIGIDGGVEIADADATTYDNGSVTFTLTANGSPTDRLSIRTNGINGSSITLDGNNVLFQGTPIGTFTGGSSLMPLKVSLTENSTLPAVQQLMRSITFGTPTNGASLATRTVVMSLDDGKGGLASGSKLIRVGALRLLQYQEGGDGGYGTYTGVGDIALSQVGHGTAYPEGRTKAPAEGLLIDWPDGGTPNESQVLMRFDNFVGTNYWQVPSNAIIVSAELLLRVNNTGDGGRFYRMLVPWDATNDTWDTMGALVPDDIRCKSVYESQLGVEDGSGATGTGIISVGVTPDVQAWVNGETNNGWAIIGWPLRTDGTGFTPSEYSVVKERPRLRVLWFVPEQTTQVSFRQGVNGYTSSHDTNLRQANPSLNYGTEDTIWSDANDANGTNNTQGLLRFDDIIGSATNQIPPGAFIQSAMLELPSVGPDNMGDGGRFFAMLQPWDDTTVTWITYGTNGIQPDGIIAATNATTVAGSPSLSPDVQGTINAFDVTADVQAWASGARTNYGWAILPWPGGANGWGFRSAEWSNFVYPDEPERERPRLRVFYTLNSVVDAPVLHTVGVSPNQIQVPFTGTIGKTYSILRAPTPTGPWDPAGSATVGSDGTATFVDTTPLPDRGFYRVVYP